MIARSGGRSRLRLSILAATLAWASGAAGADPARGKQLYQNHCQGCHSSGAHLRENRKATSLTELYRQVTRWSGVLDLPWGKTEVDDVSTYLNERYYRFDN